MIKEVELIRQLRPRTEQILQLAEEANELAIESIKLKNKMKYTLLLEDEDFIEEIADVKICIDIVGDYNHEIPKLNNSRSELFDLLIKYCCGLSKAAIKLRRTMISNGNPTPVRQEEAEDKLREEIINVKSCIFAIGDFWDCDKVNDIYKFKAKRCLERYNQSN